MVLFLFWVFRTIVIAPDLSADDICAIEYGEGWEYEYSRSFGRTCIELDFISLKVTDRRILDLTHIEARDKYCDYPGFFELTKWSWECEG